MENKQPLVSVIMNCYNSDTYLKEAIDSVIAQTYTNWEIIFWDNQSTDKSAQIVKSYNDERIKYYYASTHTSLGEGRNRALEKVNGDFISFLDCDDFYLPQKLRKTLEAFDDQKIGLVYTNGYTLYEDKNIKKPFYKKPQIEGNIFNQWIASYNAMIPSVMFRKSVLKNLNYWFDKRFNMIEEYDFFLNLSQYCQIRYCHNKLCIWRAHKSSITWRAEENFQKELIILKEKLLKNKKNLPNRKSIEKLDARIAYRKFLTYFQKNKEIKRELIYPYITIDKRLLFLYAISFLGEKILHNILFRLNKIL